MPACCTFRDDAMNATIQEGPIVVACSNRGAADFHRRKSSRRSKVSFSPLILCCVTVVLVLVAESCCFCRPVEAFTASRTPVTPTSREARLSLGERALEQRSHKFVFSPIHKVRHWKDGVRTGFRRRIKADPSFLGKSITEVLVAAGTQLMAEWNRRGASRMIAELDFVVPAVLTAVFGKYYRWVCACLRSKQECRICAAVVDSVDEPPPDLCQIFDWPSSMATFKADASGKLGICVGGSVVRAREPFAWTVRGIRFSLVLCIHLCLSRQNTFDFRQRPERCVHFLCYVRG